MFKIELQCGEPGSNGAECVQIESGRICRITVKPNFTKIIFLDWNRIEILPKLWFYNPNIFATQCGRPW